jgi:formylglycine-generating enzyme required for sulfatase activity
MTLSLYDIAICQVSAGVYPIGDDTIPYSSPAHTVKLEAYAIGMTAVTNQQFAAFIDAGGYQEARYWSEMGWRWQSHKQLEYPAFWHDLAFNQPSQPVVGVCWYEADAFSLWLAHETGVEWRLPSEVEWEAAARGSMGHKWPVGRAPDPNLTNTLEHGLGHPWPAMDVGNVSWCGAHDLCGNVWEWCSTRWGRNWQIMDYIYPYDRHDGRENLSGSHARLIRGGSWDNPLAEAQPAYRARYLPGSRASNIGFRLAQSL